MKILFQGDSITWWYRNSDNPDDLGNGYVKFASEIITARHSDTDFKFINRGISGDRVGDLAARWQSDCIDLEPDLLSILIGTNDTWHCADNNRQWMPHEQFEGIYRGLLTDVREKTHAKILIIEQFILPSPDKDFFRCDLDPKIQITRKLAREFADEFIPMDGLFAKAIIHDDPTEWAADGVHPTEKGARLIAEYYADAFDRITKL